MVLISGQNVGLRSKRHENKQEAANNAISTQKVALADQTSGTFRNSLFVESGKCGTLNSLLSRALKFDNLLLAVFKGQTTTEIVETRQISFNVELDRQAMLREKPIVETYRIKDFREALKSTDKNLKHLQIDIDDDEFSKVESCFQVWFRVKLFLGTRCNRRYKWHAT